MHKPLVLAVLDGWGCSDDAHGNAIAAAKIPHWHAFFETYPWVTLQASGEAVGLPKGIMGNSEVGHMNIGSGRVVPQGVVVIDEALRSGAFATNATLAQCLEHVKRAHSTLHLLGLLSDGQVHSSITHLFALIDAAVEASVPVAIHAFLDGRDTPPRSARIYLEQLESKLERVGRAGSIASIGGRFYAMDRDKRWERTDAAFTMLAKGQAKHHTQTALEGLDEAYARDESDEFVVPTLVGPSRTVGDGDACIFFNFRPDRARQLTERFNSFTWTNGLFATMTKYDEKFANPVLFGPRPQYDTFGEVISRAGLTQLRLAETEKYAHVTYFFNGGREDVFPGEDRELVPSDRSVATYDLAPEMRANEITGIAVRDINAGTHDVIIMNYANADMVGHTGKWDATIESIEILDGCLQQLADAVLAKDGILAITADHGNAEEKLDGDGNPLTAHTTNPVPFILIGKGLTGTLDPNGKLGDIAPTLLTFAGLDVPSAMTGNNLWRSHD